MANRRAAAHFSGFVLSFGKASSLVSLFLHVSVCLCFDIYLYISAYKYKHIIVFIYMNNIFHIYV